MLGIEVTENESAAVEAEIGRTVRRAPGRRVDSYSNFGATGSARNFAFDLGYPGITSRPAVGGRCFKHGRKQSTRTIGIGEIDLREQRGHRINLRVYDHT